MNKQVNIKWPSRNTIVPHSTGG